MFTVVLAGLGGAALVSAAGFTWLRWSLHNDVRNHFLFLEQEIDEYERRYSRISSHALNHLLGLTRESNKALVEAPEILGSMRDYAAYVRKLVISSDDRDWALAEELLTGEVVPLVSKTESGFRLAHAANWRERLELCIQTIGSDVFHLSELYRKNIRPLHDRIPTPAKELVELGVRAAMKVSRMRLEYLPHLGGSRLSVRN